MDKAVFIMKEDKRLAEIAEHIVRLANADFTKKGEVSEEGDDLYSIVIGFNLLGEELESYNKQLNEGQAKIKNTLVQLEEAQRLAHIGSWEMDMATNKVQWSNEMFNIYGYGNERFELSLEKAMERMLPEDLVSTSARMKKNIKEAIQTYEEKGILEFESAPSTFNIA